MATQRLNGQEKTSAAAPPDQALPEQTPTDSASSPEWHSLSVEELLRRLDTNHQTGLDSAAASQRLTCHGINELAAEEQRGLPAILRAQLTDFMILVLLAAAFVSGLLGDLRDAIAIIVIVVLNAVVGTFQEYRAQRAIAALRSMAALDARVVRDAEPKTVPASELVPGDIVKLAAGDIVPADLRLIETAELQTDESSLTGESLPVVKSAETLAATDLPIGDRSNLAYKQTAVAKGSGTGIVVATGLRTEIGRIATLLGKRRDLRTPLQQRLADFGRKLALAVLGICLVIFALGVVSGQPPLLMFLTAVSLAVAAIPEALPAVVTVALAIGARKLGKLRSLVRRLPAVESLGSVTYICADKTGTLTENRMTLVAAFVAGRTVEDFDTLDEKVRSRMLAALALCNEVDPADPTSGDPTELALLEAASAAGAEKAELLEKMPQLAVLAFDSKRQLMTTLHHGAGGMVAYTKGAPERVFDRCQSALDESGNKLAFDEPAAQAAVDEFTSRSYRLLAIAFREFDPEQNPKISKALETEMTFLGLIALHDPIRAEVPQAIRECRTAGITPIMITGDHPQTALNIAVELGLADAHTPVVTGRELGDLSNDSLLRLVRRGCVFARISPEQKIRIVETLQDAGEFVAMTGDGVNDAPALKRASIGVAMGGRGTDVAREASDLVLLDDNFATIVAAVHEGRRIYDNIRKFIRYTMTSNSGEIFVLLIASLIALPLPLLPIHILWINLVTDGLPGLAFSAEPVERDVMRRPPRPPVESVFAGGTWQYMLWVGLLIAGLTLITASFTDTTNVIYWQTMVFTTLVTAQLLQAFAMRSEHDSLLRIGLFSNRYMFVAITATLAVQLLVVYVPFLNAMLKTTPLAVTDLLICLGLGCVVAPLVEFEKAWRTRSGRRSSQ